MRHFFILLSNRLIRLVGNILKFFFYLLHLLFPRMRFTLPDSAPPLREPKQASTIPRILWQTNYTNRVTLAVYVNYLFNRLMCPGFSYRFMITEAREAFIKEHYSAEIFESYSRLQIGAAQADFWRLLVLQKYGGVYMDIDAYAVWPLGSQIRPEDEELYLTTKRGDISNYFIASKPDNPHLQQMIELIMKNIQENTIKNVFELTGPGVFNHVLDVNAVNTCSYRYLCNQGSFTNDYFQYVDKPQGKWTKEQFKIDIVRKD